MVILLILIIYGISYPIYPTGEINVTLSEHNPTKLVSEIINLGIKEVVVSDKLDKVLFPF